MLRAYLLNFNIYKIFRIVVEVLNCSIIFLSKKKIYFRDYISYAT